VNRFTVFIIFGFEFFIMLISRQIVDFLKTRIATGKILVISGPRQVGKTTLAREVTNQLNLPTKYFNGDLQEVRAQFAEITIENLRNVVGGHAVLIIDEAQRIENIGLILKIIYDELPGKMILVTGSSSLELGDSLYEPLTGRKLEYHLYPISWNEYTGSLGDFDKKAALEKRLIFGCYPDVINQEGDEYDVLFNLAESYLYKDIFALVNVRKPQVLQKLTRALAYQIGGEVSYNELSNLVGIDKNTVAHYIDLLEKAFVVVTLQPLSRNLRNEISTSRKVYFMDNGIRNMIINDFKPLSDREDVGALWENFLFIERMKRNHYARHRVNHYFWRTHAQQEVDLVEEKDGAMKAFEFKWNPKRNAKLPRPFDKAYNVASFDVINTETFEAFLT
jgi:uncharacterized protein